MYVIVWLWSAALLCRCGVVATKLQRVNWNDSPPPPPLYIIILCALLPPSLPCFLSFLPLILSPFLAAGLFRCCCASTYFTVWEEGATDRHIDRQTDRGPRPAWTTAEKDSIFLHHFCTFCPKERGERERECPRVRIDERWFISLPLTKYFVRSLDVKPPEGWRP